MAQSDWYEPYVVAHAARSQARAAALESLMQRDPQHAGVIAALITLLA